MTFLEARTRLAEISNNGYRTTAIQVTDDEFGSRIECRLYLESIGWIHAKTWEEAFATLESAIAERNVNHMAEGA